jgi:hypothetical protein
MDKSIRQFTLSFFILLALGSLAFSYYTQSIDSIAEEPYLSFFKNEEDHETAGLPLPISVELPEILNLPSLKGKLNKDLYEDHLEAAESIGAGIIENEWKLYQLLNDNHLVEINKGSGYQLEPLTHSHPYVTPHSKKILEEIGQMYEVLAGEGSFFSVSSATRTMDQQKNLKKRNRNAAEGNSSHSYGVSFDISYIRFNGVKDYNLEAQKNLETVLNHFQKTDKIYVIKERNQSCYHVTVR